MGPEAPVTQWLDYEGFLADLDDPGIARSFLADMLRMSYEIREIEEGETVQSISDALAVMLARSYWPLVFLAEYPDFGEYEQ